ncbi:MAG: hypothetical protein FWB75_01900 [Oscillospiraceae bacterium]|nr:hypothetical protein [Oscillospiraceae bacterium]
MKIKFQKTMNIVSELLSYCQLHGAKEYHLDIKEEDGAVTLLMRACPELITDSEFEFLKTALSAPRQRDVEQQYWELVGESDVDSELTLIGMLCDEAKVEYADSVLTIWLKRLD